MRFIMDKDLPEASESPVEPQNAPPEPVTHELGDKLYTLAKSCLGEDIAATQDELGCAEAVSYLMKKILPGFPAKGFLSTADLFHWLWLNPGVKRVMEPQPGDIIISPTGLGKDPHTHGHVGIVGKEWIMSNNSMNGLWQATYTLETWNRYYAEKLGFPVQFYTLVDNPIDGT